MHPSQKSLAPSNPAFPGSSPFYPSPARTLASQCFPNLPCHCLNTRWAFFPTSLGCSREYCCCCPQFIHRQCPFWHFSPHLSPSYWLSWLGKSIRSFISFWPECRDWKMHTKTNPHRRGRKSQHNSRTPSCPISDGFLYTPTAMLLHQGFQSLCFFTYLAH